MQFSNGHALLIGVGAYTHAPQLDVPAAAADARAVAQVLCDPRFCGYPADQVTLLQGPQATRATMLAALEHLADSCADDATALVFYCGHGALDPAGGYFLTAGDTRVEGGSPVPETAVGQRELLERLRALRARRTLLIFNACHAGALSPTLDLPEPVPALVTRSLPDELGAALLATGSGRAIVAACRADQRSYVGAGQLTLFTQALVAALLGRGVVSRDGTVGLFDLYMALFDQVSATVKAHYGALQEPELTLLEGVGPFPVALFRGAATLSADPTQVPAAPRGAVRRVSDAHSRLAIDRLVAVGQGVAIGGDMRGGTAVALGPGASISAPVTIQAPVSQGVVVGANIGGTVANQMHAGSQQRSALGEALAAARSAVDQAAQAGDRDLADDLGASLAALELAERAEQAGRAERRAAKIAEARGVVERLLPGRPHLAALLALLARL
jgi:hypothetical protein